MSYPELKERLEKLQNTDFSDDYPEVVVSEFNDLAEDILYELRTSEHSLYLLKRKVPSEISLFYPRITRDPTINCFKDNRLVATQTLENPDFTKLHKLGLYAISDSDYCIRTTQQLEYISKFLRGEWELRGCSYYINFD